MRNRARGSQYQGLGPWLVPAALAWVMLAGLEAHAQSPRPAMPPVPVTTALATIQDVPVFLRGLGTVQAYRSVTVRARVDGVIDRIIFTEGQDVRPGDLLAQIDPRPNQAALDQAIARKAANQALLDAAEVDLDRYIQLARTEAASRQRLDTIRAQVGQLTAAIQGDKANIAAAKLNLDYTHILAPIEGRVGLRLVDQGNFVRQAESQGIVTLSQMRPISVIFTLPQDTLPRITQAMARGRVAMQAYASDDRTLLDEGELLTPDSAIDPATGTIKLKATFPNSQLRLWPGQFVNTRLLIETRVAALTVPSAAVQRGLSGLYVYIVKPDATVVRQDVEVALDNGTIAVLTSGPQADDPIVTAGHSRLGSGSRVVGTPSIPPTAAPVSAGTPVVGVGKSGS
ncbi:MAG: efflux RND transporter periplasmic adaptor subunit [Acetobacteraceae bacterium]|nr:efflux RND transporter periplasmic adaptor subunit [Acetobacteraceae bacterium]